MSRRVTIVAAVWILAVTRRAADAHDGPPFPIVSDQRVGAYVVSIWTDPDATDDGSAGGQFWVQLQLADRDAAVPATTRATVGVRPVVRTAPMVSARAEPVRDDVTNQFAALVMDREERFAVEVTIDGPAGRAMVMAEVDATYDLRPPPFMLAVYALPFLLAGVLWIRLLVKRRTSRLEWALGSGLLGSSRIRACSKHSCSVSRCAGTSPTLALAQQAPQRSIVNLTGQLYRAQNNNHYTVYLVTPEGVIMSDPINRDFARWLKAEIATRHKVPVRYVLYTHHDWDHASGGVVFADTAQFVGHVNMLAEAAVPPGNPPLPAAEAKLDANKNGLVDRSEATGNHRRPSSTTSTPTTTAC